MKLATKPDPNLNGFGPLEAHWRDPAMAKLGYGAGLGEVQKYIEDLRTAKGTDWSYCAFFTKYPVGWFAYASIGGPRLVMDFANDGWGPDNIDRVFAHETGHIFGAPDEYASSGCTCGGSWGFFGKPNGNCANCAPDGGVACLMKANSWEMCSYTPWHLGFPQGARYSGVFKAGSGKHGLWVNADWNHFVAKWQDWSSKGLRLDDLEITQYGSKTRFGGAFSGGSGAYGLWVNASWASFIDKWKAWSQHGLRLVDLEIARYGFFTRYSGVYRAGGGGYGLWVNASWASFVAKWQEWSGKGLRLIDLEITKYGNATRYSGVFRQGSGGYGLWVNSDWTSFKDKWETWSEQGLRLVDFEITTTGIENFASPVAPGMSEDDVGAFPLLGFGDTAVALGPDVGDTPDAGFGVLSLESGAPDGDGDGSGFGSVSYGSMAGDEGDGEDSGGEAGFGGSSFGAVTAPAQTSSADSPGGTSGMGDIVLSSSSDAAISDGADDGGEGFGFAELDA